MNEITGAGIFIYNTKTKKVLAFARRHDETTLGIPGGKPEADETPNQVAEREVFEEINLKIDTTGLKSVAVIPDDSDKPFIAFLYFTEEEFDTTKLTSFPGHAVWVDIPTLLENTKYPEWFKGFFAQVAEKYPELQIA